MLFLSRAEWNYLTANSEISEDYNRVIKSRLQKKLSVFVNQELPILIEKRYLDVTKFRNVTEKCNTLVAQPGRALRKCEIENNEKRSLGGDLDPGPLPLGGRLFEPYLTKVTLYQAELPRQLNEQSSQ
jgi:hypothetical protein